MAADPAPEPAHLSWYGFNVSGDPKSIDEVLACVHAKAREEQLQAEIRRGRDLAADLTRRLEEAERERDEEAGLRLQLANDSQMHLDNWTAAKDQVRILSRKLTAAEAALAAAQAGIEAIRESAAKAAEDDAEECDREALAADVDGRARPAWRAAAMTGRKIAKHIRNLPLPTAAKTEEA